MDVFLHMMIHMRMMIHWNWFTCIFHPSQESPDLSSHPQLPRHIWQSIWDWLWSSLWTSWLGRSIRSRRPFKHMLMPHAQSVARQSQDRRKCFLRNRKPHQGCHPRRRPDQRWELWNLLRRFEVGQGTSLMLVPVPLSRSQSQWQSQWQSQHDFRPNPSSAGSTCESCPRHVCISWVSIATVGPLVLASLSHHFIFATCHLCQHVHKLWRRGVTACVCVCAQGFVTLWSLGHCQCAIGKFHFFEFPCQAQRARYWPESDPGKSMLTVMADAFNSLTYFILKFHFFVVYSLVFLFYICFFCLKEASDWWLVVVFAVFLGTGWRLQLRWTCCFRWCVCGILVGGDVERERERKKKTIPTPTPIISKVSIWIPTPIFGTCGFLWVCGLWNVWKSGIIFSGITSSYCHFHGITLHHSHSCGFVFKLTCSVFQSQADPETKAAPDQPDADARLLWQGPVLTFQVLAWPGEWAAIFVVMLLCYTSLFSVLSVTALWIRVRVVAFCRDLQLKSNWKSQEPGNSGSDYAKAKEGCW